MLFHNNNPSSPFLCFKNKANDTIALALQAASFRSTFTYMQAYTDGTVTLLHVHSGSKRYRVSSKQTIVTLAFHHV